MQRWCWQLVQAHGFRSVALPIIGAGSGGFKEDAALQLMVAALVPLESAAAVCIVRFRKR